MAANGFRCRSIKPAGVSAYDRLGGYFFGRESFSAGPGAPPPHTVCEIFTAQGGVPKSEFRLRNPVRDNYAIGMCVMILLSRVIPQIMASSRFGEPSTARSHSRLKAIISPSS
jgi:hypothetical protein